MTTDHVTHVIICHRQPGNAQQMKHACNVQTHMANVWVIEYHIRIHKTNICLNKGHVQCVSNEHACNMTMPDD